MANATRQFFGIADLDTARSIADSLGQHTISFQTAGRSHQSGRGLRSGSVSSSLGEHVQGRPLLAPDEVMRLGSERPLVMIAGEPPYLLDRLNHMADPASTGWFDRNPMHGVIAESVPDGRTRQGQDRIACLPVVVPAGGDLHGLVPFWPDHPINDPMLLGDPA